MIRTMLWATGILAVILLLQTTILSGLVVAGAKPNLLLLVFVILATQNGSFASQIVGFALGLAVDTVTLVPLGYHAFSYALAGYLFGLGSGKVYFDPLVLPMLLGFLATLYDHLIGFLLNSIFQLGTPVTAYFHWGVLFQIVMHLILTPLVFWFYGWLRVRVQNPRRGFGG